MCPESKASARKPPLSGSSGKPRAPEGRTGWDMQAAHVATDPPKSQGDWRIGEMKMMNRFKNINT